jgi:4-amino-4-deoxy-L-arabinose transferase-like glycosyltransferase
MTTPKLINWRALLVLLLALGGLLRLIDLTDPPLDFHPTRQLRNSIIARGIYYDLLPNADPSTRALADTIARAPARYEPPVSESLMALTYLVAGGESIAIPRIYGTIFWLLAGFCLFDLARRIAGSPAAGLVSLAYFLILPFAVQASRSFQPDPLMTTFAFIGIYFLYRWSESEGASWKFAILAAVFIGFAAFIKIFIGFIIGGAAVALVLFTLKGRFWRSPQVWVMAVIMVLPALLFYFIGDRGNSTEYITNWSLDMLKLITSTDFYTKWLAFLGSLFGQTFIFLSLAGSLLAAPRGRALMIGLWAGYLFYGLSVPFQMYTHSYYHVQLTPIISLGLAPIAALILRRASEEKPAWQAGLIVLVVAIAGYQSWVARSVLMSEDFRAEPAYWQSVGEVIPVNAKVIALTQDFGYRLMYYGWRHVDLWPLASGLAQVRGNQINAAKIFAETALDKDYFLVTAFNQLEKQPDLAKILAGYPIASQGEGYILYDLKP